MYISNKFLYLLTKFSILSISYFSATILIMKAVFEKYIERIVNWPHSGGIFKASKLL